MLARKLGGTVRAWDGNVGTLAHPAIWTLTRGSAPTGFTAPCLRAAPRVLPPASSAACPAAFSVRPRGAAPVPASAPGAAARVAACCPPRRAASQPVHDRQPVSAGDLAVASPGYRAGYPEPADSLGRVRHFPSLVPPGARPRASPPHAPGGAFRPAQPRSLVTP